MPSFYDQLLDVTAPARDRFLQIPQLVRGAEGDIPLRSYIAFLTEAYHHVKHTVPLMMACGSRLDDAHERLREALCDYIAEEIGHQRWILDDIGACGGDPQAVARGMPRAETELMIAYAYDTVQRNNPVGFFGMVLVLEGTSVRLASGAADAIQRAHRLPDAAFRYLKSHGALDQQHIEFYRGVVDRLEHDADRAAVVHCANMFYRLYGDVFRSLPLDP